MAAKDPFNSFVSLFGLLPSPIENWGNPSAEIPTEGRDSDLTINKLFLDWSSFVLSAFSF